MNEKGFTLVEAIIAVAMAGVMAVVFIPLLTAQYVNIQKTGDQSDATYDAVEKVEESVAEMDNITDPNVSVSKGGAEDKVKIDIGDPAGDIEIDVDTITVKGEGKDQETELVVGVPQEEEESDD